MGSCLLPRLIKHNLPVESHPEIFVINSQISTLMRNSRTSHDAYIGWFQFCDPSEVTVLVLPYNNRYLFSLCLYKNLFDILSGLHFLIPLLFSHIGFIGALPLLRLTHRKCGLLTLLRGPIQRSSCKSHSHHLLWSLC